VIDRIRIIRVEIKARRGRKRIHTAYVKVPYGGAYAMSELLTRMLTVGELERFTVSAATADEIAVFRPYLVRWLEGLTSMRAQVDWTA
jgi:hypothetical protein